MTRKERATLLVLGLVTVAGAFFRVHDLGRSAFRADTILLWSLAERHVPPGQILSRWFEVSGAAGQMPMPAFVMQLLLQMFHLPVTPATVRLPFALMGVAAVVAAFFAGRRLFGAGFGLAMAAMMAMQPFAVQLSREAYFYSSLILGAVLFLWALTALVERVRAGGRLGGRELVLLAASLFFTGYSQMSGLIICAAGFLWFGAAAWRERRRDPAVFRWNLGAVTVAYLVLFAPMLFVAWGPREMLAQLATPQTEYGKKIAEMGGETVLTLLYRSGTEFAFGRTPPRLLLWGAVLGGGLLTAAWRRERLLLMPAIIVVAQFLLFVATRSTLGAAYESRYLVAGMPFYLVFLVYGLWMFPRWLAEKAGRAGWTPAARGALCALALGACVQPSWWATQLNGKPTPYYDVVRWCDAHLPRGTLVLVDRWFEPWNELAAHPSTNVFFTFTVPDEPVETFLANRWRDTAKAFFEKFPDAAYFERMKHYWEVPGVGPWSWPRERFARHVVISNAPGLALRRVGLAARGDFYQPMTNGLVVEIFYDARDDVVAKARAAGRRALCFFGPSWGHTKLWRQYNDFRDWRVLSDRAELEIWNLADVPAPVTVKLRAVAAGSSKRVQFSGGGSSHVFSGGQVAEWSIGPLELGPGRNEVVLTDPLWERAQVPLLVEDVSVE